jgi:hypothetical protein
VSNPYADQLTFIANRTRTRRDHMKYLTLLRTIAFVHQYQRPVKTVQHHGQTVLYIEVTPEDIAVGNRLAHQVLGRSLDELPPQTRRFLGILQQMVAQDCQRFAVERSDYRFTRRQIRQYAGAGATQTRAHLERLIELEYVGAHRIDRGQSYQYSLLYDGDAEDGGSHLCGLIDAAALTAEVTPTTKPEADDEAACGQPHTASDATMDGGCRGETRGVAGSNRPPIGPESGGCREANSVSDSGSEAVYGTIAAAESEKALIGPAQTAASYVPRHHTHNAAHEAAPDAA